MNTSNTIFKRADFIAILAITIYMCALMFLSGNISNAPEIIDAHDEVEINHIIKEEGLVAAFSQELKYRLSHRFLPVYSIVRVFKVYVFGEHWSAYYLYNLVLGILGGVFLYWFGRLIKLSVLASLVFTFFTFIGFESWFNQATIMYRIANAELPGMVILALGLIAMAYSARKEKTLNGFEVLFLVSMILNTMIKESFIVLTPALLFWKAWLYSTNHNIGIVSSLKKHAVQIIITMVVVLGEIAIIGLVIGTSKMSYVGVSSGMGQVISTIKTTKSFLNEEGTIPLLFTTLCVALGMYASQSLPDDRVESLKHLAKKYWYHLFLAAAIVAPQIVTYATSGIYERYKLPLMLGITFLLASLFNYIYQSPKRFFVLKITFGLLFLLIFYRNSVNAFANAKSYANTKNETKRLLDAIPDNSAEKILIVNDPVLLWETDVSLIQFLAVSKGCTNVKVASVSIGHNERLFTTKSDENFKHLVKTHEEEIGQYYERAQDTVGYKYVIYTLPEYEEIYLEQQSWYHNPHDSLSLDKFTLLIYQ